MQIPDDLRYAQNHEWSRLQDDGTVQVGITDFAQDALGDIVFVDLPEVGSTFTAGESFGEIESTKSVSDLYAPVAGTVIAVNERLAQEPELINAAPYGDGWMIVLRPEDPAQLDGLMDSGAYSDMTADE